MEQIKRLILKSCILGKPKYFVYPVDKFPEVNFVELLRDMESEGLVILNGKPAVGACNIQITDYGLDFLK